MSKARIEDSDEPISKKVRSILLQFRATPLQGGKSSAELFLNRQIRIRLDAIKPNKPKNPPMILKIQEYPDGQRVQARIYESNRPKWCSATMMRRVGRLHHTVRLHTGYILKRHID